MITLGFVTSRHEHEFAWFILSLSRQSEDFDDYEIICVDLQNGPERVLRGDKYVHTAPKPTVFQGKHRLTREDWWAVSNARNTVTALARGSYIVWLDDRSLAGPQWLEGIREAAETGYAVCGAYEKRENMVVENGKIFDTGQLISRDHRMEQHRVKTMTRAVGAWFFGGTLGMPLEWALALNGPFDERMDSASAEDTMCGLMLENNGYKIVYDTRVFITEDRTPGKCGPDMRRSSKERHPHDKTDKLHTALRTIAKEKRANPYYDMQWLRDYMRANDEFPTHGGVPSVDWFDGMAIGPQFDDCYEKSEWPKR